MNSRLLIDNAAGVYFSNEDLIEFLTVIAPESADLRTELAQKIYQYNIKANSINSLTEYLTDVGYEFLAESTVSWCYKHYCLWCKQDNLEAKSKAEFSRAVYELYNLESKVTTKDGIRVRVYRAV